MYPTVIDQAKLCNFDGYNAKRAARDVMAIQTSNHKLWKQALAKGMDYPDFFKYGLALEASKNHADTIKKAEGINQIKSGQRFFKKNAKGNTNNSVKGQSEHQGQTKLCDFCGYKPRRARTQGKCSAKENKRNNCKKKELQVDEESSDKDIAGRVEEVPKMEAVHRVPIREDNQGLVEVKINGTPLTLRVDSRYDKGLILKEVFKIIQHTTRLTTPKIKLRPYGTKEFLEVKGRAKVVLVAANKQTLETICLCSQGTSDQILVRTGSSKDTGNPNHQPGGIHSQSGGDRNTKRNDQHRTREKGQHI